MNDAHLFDFRSYVKCDNDVIDLRTHCATGEGGRVPQTMIESRVLMCFLILLQSEFQFLLMAFVPSDRAGYRAHRLIKKKSREETAKAKCKDVHKSPGCRKRLRSVS